jgi:hypothetical protein
MNTKTPDAQISDATEAAAQNDTRLICLLIDGAPDSPHCVSLYGISGIPDYWAEMVPKVKEAQEARVQKIEALLAKSNASGIVQSTICAAIEVKHVAARAARVSDEAYVAANLRDTPDILREVVSGVLFHSPIGFQMNRARCKRPQPSF